MEDSEGEEEAKGEVADGCDGGEEDAEGCRLAVAALAMDCILPIALDTPIITSILDGNTDDSGDVAEKIEDGEDGVEG